MNEDKFPSLANMTAHAHSLNLTAGFYGNNCMCSDHVTDVLSFAAEVNFVIDAGFDSVKLDGCGKQEDIGLWYELYNCESQPGALAPARERALNRGPD